MFSKTADISDLPRPRIVVRHRAPSPCLEEVQDICGLATSLADFLAGTPSRQDYRTAQRCALEVERLLKLDPERFVPPGRPNVLYPREAEKVRRAATQFLKAFDRVFVHYGWHTETSRAENIFQGEPDAPQQPPPPTPDEEKLLTALRKSAKTFLRAVVSDFPRKLGPESKRAYLKEMVPNTRFRLIAALAAAPEDATDEEIAHMAGLNRTAMYRLGYKRLRNNIRALNLSQLEQRTPRGRKFRDRLTGNQIFEATDDHSPSEGVSDTEE